MTKTTVSRKKLLLYKEVNAANIKRIRFIAPIKQGKYKISEFILDNA